MAKSAYFNKIVKISIPEQDPQILTKFRGFGKNGWKVFWNPKKCHLHEIKNLSEKFIYFNDDITFFNPICPEDYFEDENHKVYLNGKASGYPSGGDQGYSYDS